MDSARTVATAARGSARGARPAPLAARFAAALLLVAATASAQDATLIRLTDTSAWGTPSPDPAAVAYLPGDDRLLIADSEVNEIPALFTGDNVYLADRAGTFESTLSTIGITDEPAGLTHDPVGGRLFIATDQSPRRVHQVAPGADGRLLTPDDVVVSIRTGEFGSSDAEGLAWNPALGALHLVDGATDRLFTIDLGDDGALDDGDAVTSVDLAALGLTDPEGVAFDPRSEALYVVGKPSARLLHVTPDGRALRTVSLAGVGLYKPAGLTVAPSSLGNGADSLYVVDRGVDNDSDPTENDGRLFELALPPLPGNRPPTVEIGAPGDDATFAAGDTVEFAATASDAEEGDLSATIEWSSDRDGPLGGGAALSTASLSVGLHRINASATDGAGAQGLDSLFLRVTAAGTTVVETRVARGADDAEQRGPGAKVWVDSEDLELVRDSVDQSVGLRFEAVDLPPGVTIEHAYIQFQTDRPEAGALALDVRAEASDDAAPITRAPGDLDGRPTTDATVDWQPPDWTLTGERGAAQRTADLAPLVQELVDRPGWRAGRAMLFLIDGPGAGAARRAAVAFETDPEAAPLLHVRYGATPASPAVTVRHRVASGADDAEERGRRRLALTSSDLELNYDDTLEQVVGLRFTGVRIPRGAAIRSATVQFQVDEPSSELAFLEIRAEDDGDAAPFVAERWNLSRRARTSASVSWLPSPWERVGAAGADQRTPDLAALVEAVVSRPDWRPGNALALLIDGDGARVAEAFDGAPGAAPELVVTYTTGGR